MKKNIFLVCVFFALFIAVKSTEAVSVTKIYPCSGTNNKTTNVTIWGSDFIGSPSVKLKRSAEIDIDGYDVNVSNQNRLTCTFDLRNKFIGTWDVFVGVNGSTVTLKMAFTVNKLQVPEIRWIKTVIPTEETYALSIGIGDGNNDDNLEVYGIAGHHHYQFNWNENGWNKLDLGPVAFMYGTVIGDGNNDGELEVYGGWGSSLYQLKWNGQEWNKMTVGSGMPSYNMWDVTIGDGDNDGNLEIYCSSQDKQLYQFKWNGVTWDKTVVGLGEGQMNSVAIGDGDNDGNLEVYVGSIDRNLYQYKWNGSNWDGTYVDSGGAWVWGVAVGDGNNDGKLEVYAGKDYDKCLYQYSWNGGTWDRMVVGYGKDRMDGVAIGDGDNDGKLEVYGANNDGYIYQFKWNGNIWEKTSLGAGESFMYDVAIGDGNNDGQLEVYGANYDGYFYQFISCEAIAPELSLISYIPPFTFENRITITGMTELGNIVRIYVNGRLTIKTVANDLGNFSEGVILTKGNNIIEVTATDAFGNTSSKITINIEYIEDPSNVIAYPNPCKNGLKVTFKSLPKQATINIYTINGELVKTIKKNDSEDRIDWYLVNDDGKKVASGIYIYLVANDKGRRKAGKIALIR